MKYFSKFIWLGIILLPLLAFSSSNIDKQTIKTNSGMYLFSTLNMPNIKAVAFNSNGNEIWGTSLMNNKNAIFVIYGDTGKKITNIDLAKNGGVEIVFSKDGTKAYVSQMETAKVFELDTSTKKNLKDF